MAPAHSRHLLILTVPTAIAILGFFWYRRKRLGSKKTDPGEASAAISKTVAVNEKTPTMSATAPISAAKRGPTFSRSLSGVDTAPIDIVIPPKLRGSRSNPLVISDEDLDREIEKLNMIKFGGSVDTRKSSVCGEPTLAESKTCRSIKKMATPTPPSPPRVTVAAQTVAEETTPVEKEVVEESVAENDVAKNDFAEDDVTEDVQAGSNETEEMQRPNNERDSANHSPLDCVVSPSPSSIPDNHSEGSNDSGKGCSETVTPPPALSLVPSSPPLLFFEFVIPQQLVGKLIGKNGSSVTNIKNKTGAHVIVRKHPEDNKLKVCSIEGTQKEIDSALKLIRDKFPLKRFPEVTLEQVIFAPPTLSYFPDIVKLVEGLNNDTIVSHVLAPNHLFLQQPTHPSYSNFFALQNYMNVWYSETESPLLPAPTLPTVICMAFSVDCWYRVMIMSSDENSSLCYVKFLDYGGYAWIEYSNLRQIRCDFMNIPFQAAECILANVDPINGEWTEESYTAVSQLTKGVTVFTQIVGFTPEDIPLVNCYLLLGPKDVVFLNRELVNQGHAVGAETGDEAAGVSLA